MRLIDADAFADFIKNTIKAQKFDALKVNDTTLTVAEVLESVVAELEGTSIDGFKNNPTIEPQPERMRGKWVLHTYMPHVAYCTSCERDSPYNRRWDFCPNCGADMRGEQDLPPAQPELQWIPCSERLPDDGEVVLTQANFRYHAKMAVSSRVDYNYWTGWGTRDINVVAWQPLPEPYKEDKDGN